MNPIKIKFIITVKVSYSEKDIIFNTIDGIKRTAINSIQAKNGIENNRTILEEVKDRHFSKLTVKFTDQINLIADLDTFPVILSATVTSIEYTCIEIFPDKQYVIFEPGVGQIMYLQHQDQIKAVVVDN